MAELVDAPDSKSGSPRGDRPSNSWDARLIFLAAWVFVPGACFQTTLKHPVGFGEYATLPWLGTSLATVAGALGAGLEDEKTVREASYSYRQRRRHEDGETEDGSQAGPAGR